MFSSLYPTICTIIYAKLKEVATRTQDMGWVEAVRFGETIRIIANQTRDAKEGREAFKEKRNPKWQGR